MIIGTAGHIDHGKTSLVKALTGIDTDRLKEEKRRGITLELGFAHLQLLDGTVAGVVDVPGHERFVKAMAAGAGGVDLAILVVAADEAEMIPCSSKTGEGLPALKEALTALAKNLPARPLEGPTFLPVDRAFTMKGFGTVVTGTLLSGQLAVEDSASLLPGLPGPLRV